MPSRPVVSGQHCKSENKGSTIIILCSEVCTLDMISHLFSLLSTNTFFCLLQQRPRNKTVFLKIYVNHTNANTNSVSDPCRNSRRDLQQSDWFGCESEGSMDTFSQQLRSQDSMAKGSLEVNMQNAAPLLKHFHFAMPATKEAICETPYFRLDIKFKNSTFKSQNESMEHSDFSQMTTLMEDGHNCINISLRLENYILSQICTVWIIWLILILFVFLLALNIIAYKVLRGNNERLTCAQYEHTPEPAGIHTGESRTAADLRRTKSLKTISEESHRRRSSTCVVMRNQLPSILEFEALRCIDTGNSVLYIPNENLEDMSN
ncbi:transmembrane protein 156 isoform X3 [Ambystoma mexicanum]|uniref:transmembrane protein 156 isoform X3 n=1 Tax=Ambystoma mexicanum TaxID=8296 RepID=UPI0037E997E6